MPDLPVLKPKRLQPGDRIGLIAPASHGSFTLATEGIAVLKQQGYKVTLGDSVREKFGYLAGSDEERATDLNAMFADPAIDAILCLRGGYGTMRLLNTLDYELIRTHPKIFMGYSDITALLVSISQRTGLVTFHGPMVAADFGRETSDYTWESFMQAIENPAPLGLIASPPDQYPPTWLIEGEACGSLIGGNLSLLTATLGTPYEIDTADKILCIEEVGEAPYRIDRMLTQLLLAGKLEKASGIVMAVCHDCEETDDEPGFTLQEVLRDRLGHLNKPVLSGLYFGHTRDKATLPFGIKARLSSAFGGLVLTENALS